MLHGLATLHSGYFGINIIPIQDSAVIFRLDSSLYEGTQAK